MLTEAVCHTEQLPVTGRSVSYGKVLSQYTDCFCLYEWFDVLPVYWLHDLAASMRLLRCQYTALQIFSMQADASRIPPACLAVRPGIWANVMNVA
jgi:hypothetical protein